MAGQPLVVVLDACLSFRLARMLAGYHENHPTLTFKAMDDFHAQGTEDRDWLVGFPDEPPHIVITKDDALLKETGQLRAWIKGGLTVVIFGPEFANLKREQMAATIFQWLPTIVRTIQASPQEAAFSVPTRFSEMERLPTYVPPRHRKRPRRPRNPMPSRSEKQSSKLPRIEVQPQLPLGRVRTRDYAPPELAPQEQPKKQPERAK
ncbi:hypothetical protein [Falsiroseomonas sp. HW251]|uniref:PIN-like domain-containing protein n=1 Tax=Falsiroseomonas sp. HW251 TaxID=3390998 RepID=UPI003D3149E3